MRLYLLYEVILQGLIMSSPSNPTGVMLSPDELQDMCAVCKRHDILFISDEIYHGITYGTQKEATAVAFSDSTGLRPFSHNLPFLSPLQMSLSSPSLSSSLYLSFLSFLSISLSSNFSRLFAVWGLLD